MLTRIDALYAAGRSAEVPRELDRLLEISPDEAGTVLATMIVSRQGEVLGLLQISRDEQAAVRAQRELLPLAEAIDRWLKLHSDSDEAVVQLRAADAYRLARRYKDALRLYDQILAIHPDTEEGLFGRAECLYHMTGDRDTDAMIIYRRIGSAGSNRIYYWPAQLRMLQLLDRTQRNTHRIAPRIRRLRQQDAKLGGERWRRGFERLLTKYS